jgi:hypothetical protein
MDNIGIFLVFKIFIKFRVILNFKNFKKFQLTYKNMIKWKDFLENFEKKESSSLEFVWRWNTDTNLNFRSKWETQTVSPHVPLKCLKETTYTKRTQTLL